LSRNSLCPARPVAVKQRLSAKKTRKTQKNRLTSPLIFCKTLAEITTNLGTMKGQRKCSAGKSTLPLAAIVAIGLVSQASAQIITLSDLNSVAQVAPNTQNGMFYWAVQGQNQLQQQWFWYGVGNGPVHSIETISGAALSQPTGRELITTYNNGLYSVSIDYLLTGGTVVSAGQQAASDIGETIKIVNTSGAVLPFHFYQYSYFNLNGQNSDVVQLGKNGRGLFNDALQMDAADQNSMTETVTTPGANHGEVGTVGVTLAKLNGGGPVLLSDNAGPVGPAGVTWALEWDLNIAPGGSAIISKDKSLNVLVIPEPSTLALLGLGGLAGCLARRRRA
jgi:hypothetical protein